MLLSDIAHGIDPIIREAPTSSKDYIALKDVCWLLERIVLQGNQRVYNVASGEPLSHGELADALSEASLRCITFEKNAQHRSFPRIDITRISLEFGFRPLRLVEELRDLIDSSKSKHNQENHS